MFVIFYLATVLSAPSSTPHCGGYYYPLRDDSVEPYSNSGEPAILYLNFDGVTVTKAGADDPKKNMSWIHDFDTVDIPPFKAEDFIRAPLASRQDVIDAIVGLVRYHYALLNVLVTTERPPDDVNYQMMIVGGSASLITSNPGGMVGVSPMDCGNLSNSDVSFTFSEDLSSIEDIATTVAHEAGHSFGLAHVDNQSAIMNPYVTPAPEWEKGNVPDGQACDGTTYQDSYLVLSKNLTSTSDHEPPWVDFVSPGDGAKVTVPLVVNLVTGDQHGLGKYVDLFVDGAKYDSKAWPYFSFKISNLEEGKHTLKAIVTDEAGNSSSTEITIGVDKNCASESSCTAGKAGIGEDCKKESSCKLGTCVISNSSGDSWCSTECIPDTSSCAFGMQCLPTEDGESYFCAYGDGTVKPKTNSDDHLLGCNSSGKSDEDFPVWFTMIFMIAVFRLFGVGLFSAVKIKK